MTRREKKDLLKRLVLRGEYFCAIVFAYDWSMTQSLENIFREFGLLPADYF